MGRPDTPSSEPHTALSDGKRQVRALNPPSWRVPIRFLCLRFWTSRRFERYIARRKRPWAGVCAVYPCSDGRCQSLLRVQSCLAIRSREWLPKMGVHTQLRTTPSCVYNGLAKLRIHNTTNISYSRPSNGNPMPSKLPPLEDGLFVDTESYVLPSEPKTTEPGSAI